MIFCNNCGASVEEGTALCPRCGTTLATRTAERAPPLDRFATPSPLQRPGRKEGRSSELSMLAVASVGIGGIGGLLLPIVTGLIGIWLGVLARRRIAASEGAQRGAALAKAGIVLGGLNIAVWVAILLVVLGLMRS